MADPQLTDEVRRRLHDLVGDSAPAPGGLVVALRAVADRAGNGVFSATLAILARLNLPECRAEQVLERLDEHRAGLASALGRDPGLHVAALDYLSNVTQMISCPAIVEGAELERAEFEAATDPLTGLANRRRLSAAVDLELRRGRRYGLQLALLLLDVDEFKAINDEHGHGVGDRVLERLGTVLRRALREADVAARIGGDEFAVLLPECDRLGALASGRRILRRVARSFAIRPIEGHEFVVGLSGGISCAPEDASTGEDLIACADRALYKAKRAGRGQVVGHHAERRGSVRYPARGTVELTLPQSPGREACVARPIDLSRTGALLELERTDLKPGPVVLQFDEATGDPRPIEACVVRIQRQSAGAGPIRVGIAFSQPLAEDRLQRHVQRRGSAGHVVSGERE